MWLIYEFVFWFALLLASPYYLYRMRRRGGYAKGFLERFGIFHVNKFQQVRGSNPIWIHGVSVGEVNLALELIHRLKKMHNGIPLVLSTTTSTGYAIAQQKLPPDVPLFYYPLDSRFCFGKVHRLLQPRALILIEAELWPNHLRFCGKQKLPLMLINARISQRCYPRYQRFQWFLSQSFSAFKLVTVQSTKDFEDLFSLGFPKNSLLIVGNLKYDAPKIQEGERRSQFLNSLHSLGNRPLLVAGSTHCPEEEMMLDIFHRLQKKWPELLLALAPRHIERTPELEELLKKKGVRYQLRTTLDNKNATPWDVLLLNTMGELKFLYEKAALIFVGKSLFLHGGQNIIEPAACGKPILFGPHMENFTAIAEDFLKADAAIQVQSAEELETKIAFLLAHSDQQNFLSKNALKLLANKKGAFDRTLDAIQKKLAIT